MNAETIKATLPRDLMASVVVFLVALPLCMGIAIASGLPPAKGVITGIVGGLVVGWLAGAPLQVSGPAAGLTVLVFELVQQYGAAMLGPILLLAGALQLLAGRLKLGCWFRVTAPAVVYGMLAGIGILIVLSQLHVMMDAQPEASGLDNLGAFPAALWAALPFSGGNGMAAASLGLLTIACMWTWDRLRPQRLRLLPGALLGVAAATLVGLWLGLDVRRVEVPDNLADAISWLQPADLLAFADPGLLVAALAVAFIASAETLLSAAAVDRMHQGPRADFDRELTAHGVGNMLCGVLGALPMTGVIVRSSANVQAGARTRLSAMLHALWLLAAVVLLAALLEQIPVASLAGDSCRHRADHRRHRPADRRAAGLRADTRAAGLAGVATEDRRGARRPPGRAAHAGCGDLSSRAAARPRTAGRAAGCLAARTDGAPALHRSRLHGAAGGMAARQPGQRRAADHRSAGADPAGRRPASTGRTSRRSRRRELIGAAKPSSFRHQHVHLAGSASGGG